MWAQIRDLVVDQHLHQAALSRSCLANERDKLRVSRAAECGQPTGSPEMEVHVEAVMILRYRFTHLSGPKLSRIMDVYRA